MIQFENYSMDEFLNQVQERMIICFCAGQKFFELCKKYDLWSRVLYVVDNNTYGGMIETIEKNIPILSVNEMGEEIKECLLLITSMKYIDEIIFQLDEIEICNGRIFYIPDLFTEESDEIKFDDTKPTIIPKKIHYCWFGKSKLPEKFRKNIETWKEHCPDYEIVRWDESNYDVSKNVYMHQAYKMMKWGFVPDYARLDIINQHGGIYLDTDVELVKPLDSLLQFDLFCGFESSNYVAFGLGFGAVKNNVILREMMDSYNQLSFILPDGSINLTASPTYQTQILERHGLKRNGKTQLREGFIALSPEYFSPVNQYGYGQLTVNSFSIHQYAATWLDGKKREEKERIINNYRYVMGRMKKNSAAI